MPRKRYSQPQQQPQATTTWGSWGAHVPQAAQPSFPPPPPPRSPSPVPVVMDYEEALPPRTDSTRSWVDDQFERGRSRAPSAASARSYAPSGRAASNSILGPRAPTPQASVSPPRSLFPATRPAKSSAWGSRPPSVAPSVGPGYAFSDHPPSGRPPTSKAPSCHPSPSPAQFAPLAPYLDVTKATKLLSSSSPFVQQYAAVRTSLDMLRGADLEAMDPMVPKVAVIGKDEPLRARIVAALTGVMVNRMDVMHDIRLFVPFCWKVAAGHIVDDETLNEVQAIGEQATPESGLHQVNVCASFETDLVVYDFPFGSESGPGLGNYLDDRNTIVVRVGDFGSQLPFEFGTRRKSIYVHKADDEASRDVAVQQCFDKLNQMLVDGLPYRVEALSQAMRKRVIELSKELSDIPGSSNDDNAPRLSNMLTTFVDDLKKAVGASNDAYGLLRRDVLASRREFAMPPARHDARTPHSQRAASPAGSRGTVPIFGAPQPSMVGYTDQWGQFGNLGGCPAGPLQSPYDSPSKSERPLVVDRPLSPLPTPATVPVANLSVDDVMHRLDEARTNELPGHWPIHKVSSALISETTQEWLEPSDSYLDALMKQVVAASGKSIDGHFTSYTSSGLRAKVAGIVKAKILERQQTAREVFAQVLEAEGRIAVEDEDAFLALKESYRERFRGQLSLEDPQAVGKCAAALDVMATVSAYFDVAHKRFLESLRRAARTHLLDALTHDLASELMKAVDLTNAEKWLALPLETVNKRVELEDRLACLRRALDELSVALLL